MCVWGGGIEEGRKKWDKKQIQIVNVKGRWGISGREKLQVKKDDDRDRKREKEREKIGE